MSAIDREANDWLKHAESDLKLAGLAVGNPDIRPEQICFHAQQAAEKAIKAVLLSCEIGFPFTHDIEELLEVAESNGVELPDSIRNAGILTPYAVETRYPGYLLDLTDADIDEAMRTAEQTLQWARGLVAKCMAKQ